MSLFKKIKDILFDEEEVQTSKKEVKEEVEQAYERPKKEEVVKPLEVEKKYDHSPVVEREKVSDREVYKNENTFPFPDFDEDEFDNNLSNPIPMRSKPVEVERTPVNPTNNRPTNVMEYERQKKVEKRTEYTHHQKIETTTTSDRKKFRPSPIISPVYGVLNEDYKPEDIKSKVEYDTDKVDVDSVRRKAFGEKVSPVVAPKEDVVKSVYHEETPTSSYYEETETVTTTFPEYEKKEKVKTIDELLEDTSDIKIDLEKEFEITEEINVPDLDVKPKAKKEPIIDDFDETDTLENDLFDLIDSMYESREEE